jgi:hypothetical protein
VILLALLLLILALPFAPLVVNGGKAILSGRMFGATPTQAEPKYIQWGTSAAVEAATQTTLTTAAAEARTAGTGSQATITQTNDTYVNTGTITSASAQTIQEVGTFDAAGTGSPATGGVMLLRAVHGAQTLAINDQIAYTIRLQFT